MSAVYLITGDDPPTIHESARKMVRKLAGDEPDEFSLETFRESSESGPEKVLKKLLEALHTPPFLAGRTTLWLQGFSAFGEEPAQSAAKVGGTAKLLRKLAEFIQTRFPDDIALVLSGPGVDARKQLYKTCEAAGKVRVFKKPELTSRKWRDEVTTLLQHRAAERNMRLGRAEIEYLIEVIGTDTGRINMEIEKIYCYAGTTPSLAEIREVCSGNREAHFYALVDSLGNRDLGACMDALAQTMDHANSEDNECIRLIRQTANSLRRLLHVKVAMFTLKVRSGNELARVVPGLSEAEQAKLENNLTPEFSGWRLRRLGDQAIKYTGEELQDAISLFAEADKSAVSTALPRRLLLETLLLRVIAGKHE